MLENTDHAPLEVIHPSGELTVANLATVSPAMLPWIGENGRHLPIYDPTKDYYRFRYEDDAKLVYLQYSLCRNDGGHPFSEVTLEVMNVLDEHPGARLALDLRANPGGDTSVLRPLTAAIRARPRLSDGNLYVLIGRHTYSAAMIHALELKLSASAILVGEPTGGKPNFFGEVDKVTLSNSGLQLRYSTKKFTLMPASEGNTVTPEILVTESASEFMRGRDPVLDYVRSHRE